LPTGAALEFAKANAIQLICQDELASFYVNGIQR
jgi:hypothetical protein